MPIHFSMPPITQSAPKVTTKPGLTAKLPGLPDRPLTAEQRMAALQRVQSQAEQRVKLGVQLFKAAEAQASQRRDMLQQLKEEQAQLRQQIKEDIATAMKSYEAKLDQVDDRITDSVHKLEARISELQQQWSNSQQRIEEMISRSENLLDQSRSLIEAPTTAPDATPAEAMDVTADHDLEPEGRDITLPDVLLNLERESDAENKDVQP